MELLFKSTDGFDKGILLPVPAGLKKFISPWAEAFYYKYSFGSCLLQKLQLKRFCIYIWRIYIDEEAMLYPSSAEPVLAIQAMLEGDILCTLSGYGEKNLRQSTYELFYVPRGVNEARFIPGYYESFHVEIEPGFLEDIAETYSKAGELLNRFKNDSARGTPMISVGLGYIAKAIIKKIYSSEKAGGDLQIELNRHVVDLLGEYFSNIRDEEKDGQLDNYRHREILLQIKKEILSEPNIEMQSIRKLSTKYRIGETDLKKGFKILFIKTPAAFIRQHALNKAHYLLTTTEDSIERIAYEIGYNHRSNFDKAFKKQFGYNAADLR